MFRNVAVLDAPLLLTARLHRHSHALNARSSFVSVVSSIVFRVLVGNIAASIAMEGR